MYSPVTGEFSVASNRSVVLYHRLTRSNLSRLRKAAQNGLDVACLTADAAIKEQGVDGVCVLGADALPGYWDVIETESLLSVVEIVFDSLARGSTLLPWLRRLYDSSDIDNYFRRVLLNDLGSLFSVASLVSCPPLAGATAIVLTEDWPSSRLWPFFMGLWRTDSSRARLAAHLSHGICKGLDHLTVGALPRRGIADMTKRWTRALYHLARVWCLALRRLCLGTAPLPVVSLLLRTYASDANVNLGGQDRLRNMDFVVDGDQLSAKDLAFWAESGVSKERQEILKKRGYRVLNDSDVGFGPAVFVRRVLPVMLSYTTLLPGLVREDQWWYAHIAHLVYHYLIWQEVCRQIKPLAFLAHNDTTSIGVARNIILRQNGCKSIFYQHACNSSIAPSGGWSLNVIYPYLVFDVVATWGPHHSDLFRRHPGAVGECWEVGCLWSEHARLVGEDPRVRKNYVDRIETYARLKLSNCQRIVAVLDTSVSSMLSCDDIYSFLAGNLELVRKMPEVLFLYKPKLPFIEADPQIPTYTPLVEALGPKGTNLWEKICTTPNFVVLPRLFETASVIGLADLVISACFTSTTVEAIGGGKRAIYYDPTNRLPFAFWCRIPGMVCVTDQELYDRVRYLLWDCDEETYTNYLRAHCMGIEGHFDGQAITRLRRRILDILNGRHSVTAIGG